MRPAIWMSDIVVCVLTACAFVPSAPDQAALIAEAEVADLASMRAQNSGDPGTLAQYLAEDYAYIHISGNRIGKAQMLARRAKDTRKMISEASSEEETIAPGPNAVMFWRRTYCAAASYGGLPRSGSSRYFAIW